MTPPTPTPSLQVPTPTELEGFVCPSCDQPTKTGCLCSHCASFRRRDAGALAARIKELEAENAAAGRNVYRMQLVTADFAKALSKIAENDSDGLHTYTPQAMQAIARAALTLNRSENDAG